ncbi:MAG TPA: hypothetical protein PK778_00845 [Bacillota bacterium]|nr:hypothetical protein [Clostridiales bacterium]HPT84529.1 hypothetical protein [Bacillota bacterium]
MKLLEFLEKYMLVTFFAVAIFAIPVLTKIEPPKEISVAENRRLADPPVMTKESLMSGKYFLGWETYLSDRIWARDGWIRLDTALELATGHKVVRDVVITDSALLPYVAADAPDTGAEALASKMAQRYAKLARYVENYGGVFLYINVPEQCSILREAYPGGLFSGRLKLESQNSAFAAAMDELGVNYLDMRPVFKEKSRDGTGAEYYARTDHHYNLRGAYLTYLTLCDTLSSLGVNVEAKTDATFVTLPNTFNGSRGRKIYNLAGYNDKLEYIIWKNPVAFTRTDNGNPSPPVVYFLPPSSDTEVAYTLYMGGDIAETVIQTGRPWLPDCIIFGDSFTNALETVLYCSFDTMVALDFRHNTTKTIYEYIDEYKPDVVICLRDDTATLSTDGNGNLPD